jgi:hypothetical protein
VGAVYRGKNTIEDILSRKGCQFLLDLVSEMIMDSKHFGQIRLIFLDEANLPEQDTVEKLWKKTRKPIIIFNPIGHSNPCTSLRYRDTVVKAAGIDEGSAKRVLDSLFEENRVQSLKMSETILDKLALLHNV